MQILYSIIYKTESAAKEIIVMSNELTEKVKKTLKEKVEPSLAEHFGGAEVTEITEDGIVYVKMTGLRNVSGRRGRTVRHDQRNTDL